MDLNSLLKICLLIVIAGFAFKLLKLISSIIFKIAFGVLIILLVLKFFSIFENDCMINDVKEFKDKFDSVQIGTPLLTTTEDYFSLIKSVTTRYSYTF